VKHKLIKLIPGFIRSTSNQNQLESVQLRGALKLFDSRIILMILTFEPKEELSGKKKYEVFQIVTKKT